MGACGIGEKRWEVEKGWEWGWEEGCVGGGGMKGKDGGGGGSAGGGR